MTTRKNEHGQPIGFEMDFQGPWPRPDGRTLKGQYCTLVKTAPDHARPLFDAYGHDRSGQNWTYMPTSPAPDFKAFNEWYLATCFGDDPFFYCVLDGTGVPVGIASYLRINERDGSIEVGWISMSPLMQRSRISTEAMYLMMAHAFDDLGMRRYEWKCDALNAPSRSAAQRLGFVFEGIFRQCTHYKGRNRDTAWLAVIDPDWPDLKARYQRYLTPTNFDENGKQIQRLQDV